MPELPEVETIASDLRTAGLEGLKIRSAEVFWLKTIALQKPTEFIDLITGLTVLKVGRRAKFIVIELSQGYTLFIHLRMTGRFSFSQGPHTRVALLFKDGRTLFYHDTRKFGRWFLVQDAQTFMKALGPEPLDPAFTAKVFKKMLSSVNRQLKPLLLDQTFISGLGNIYVDEALWEAKLHPQKLSSALEEPEIGHLYHAIQHVLRRGLETQGTSLGKGKANYKRVTGEQGTHQERLKVFRRTGLPCPRCQTPIQRIIVAQRSTHFCPNCQN